jgi:hypothetical protein
LEIHTVHPTLVQVSSPIGQGQSARITSLRHVDQVPIKLELRRSSARLIGLAEQIGFSSPCVESELPLQLASGSG